VTETAPHHHHGWNFIFLPNGVAYRVWVALDGTAMRLEQLVVEDKRREPYWRGLWWRDPSGTPATGKAAEVLQAGGFRP
jgi:hypothetical protein